MRTTVIISDAVLRRAKERAARTGTTLSRLIEQALRETLREPPSAARPFRLPTYGAGGPPADHEPADLANALLDEDAASRGS